MGHRKLVFDDQQSVQERFQLEVQRRVDAVVERRKPVRPTVEHAAKDLERRSVADAVTNLVAEKRSIVVVPHESVPVAAVRLEKAIFAAAVVAPRVSGKELVAASARKNDLYEPAC